MAIVNADGIAAAYRQADSEPQSTARTEFAARGTTTITITTTSSQPSLRHSRDLLPFTAYTNNSDQKIIRKTVPR